MKSVTPRTFVALLAIAAMSMIFVGVMAKWDMATASIVEGAIILLILLYGERPAR